MKRIALGVLAGFMLAGWTVFMVFDLGDQWAWVASAGLRAGLILGALCLAFPQVTRFLDAFPPWLIGCAALGLLAIVRWPRAALVVVPVLIVLWLLRGRQPRGNAEVRNAK